MPSLADLQDYQTDVIHKQAPTDPNYAIPPLPGGAYQGPNVAGVADGGGFSGNPDFGGNISSGEVMPAGGVKPTNAVDAGTAQVDRLNSADVLPSGNPGSANDANALPGGSAAVPTGLGDLLKKGFDSSNILGTVTPLATGLVGLLGNQQSTDALKQGTADATKTIQDGNANIQGLLKSIYGEQSDILKPYQAVGQQGLDGLSAGLQPGGGLTDGYQGETQFTRDPNFTRNTDNADTGQFNRATDFTDPTKFNFTAADLAQDPGMQFRLDQAAKQRNRLAASSGSMASGAAIAARDARNQQDASQEFGAAYNRNENTFNNNYGRASSQFADNYGRAATQNQQNFQNNDQVFNENYSRANAQFADNYDRDATTFGNNFNRGLTEQQSNQQQKMTALMNAAGIGQNASNTLVGAKGAQGQQSATTQQLTNSQTADLQTSLASAIAAGDLTRANQISGIIGDTLKSVQSASDAAKARADADKAAANQKPGDTINVQGGAGGAGGAGGTVGNVAGGSVDKGAVTNTNTDTNTQGNQTQGSVTGTNTQGAQTNTQGNQEGADVHVTAGTPDSGDVFKMPDGTVIDRQTGEPVQTNESTTGKVLDIAKSGVGLLNNLLAKNNTSTANGLMDGSVTSEASTVAKSLVNSGSAQLAGIAHFLTNPYTVAVGAALAGALIWKNSQVHPTATKFVDDFQKPFGDHLGNVVDGFDTALATGKLDKTTAQGLYDQTKSFIDGFTADTQKFAGEGGKQATVAKQAQDTMTKNFGPNYEKILGKMQTEIAQLPDPAGGQVKAAVMPQSASQQLAQMAGAA